MASYIPDAVRHRVIEALGNRCSYCLAAQRYVLSKLELFNPRTQAWSDHFHWSQDGAIIVGVTPVGRATVGALRLNNEIGVEVRRNWVLVGWHPPSDVG
jgi:hypothetical protein